MSACAIALLLAGCSTVGTSRTSSPSPREHGPSAAELARFMRERVNVPFSFAFLESQGANRHARVYRAAIVLNEAARHLVEWKNPPVESAAGREVFFEYARHLELSALRLERAVVARDLDGAASNLDGIRQTCNSCHRFFRPSAPSHDVAFDFSTFQGGAGPW